MKILITNDDGYESLGIHLLSAWAKRLGDVTVVAPKTEQSGTSHAIDFIHPTEIKMVHSESGLTVYSMDSTPADCVRYGIIGLGQKYDLVLSGINRGVNVGEDIVYSGTVGAIFEAAKNKMPAIAFSAFVDGQAEAAEYLDLVYSYICENELLKVNPLYNVNIPKKASGIRMTYQGTQYFSDRFEKQSENMYIQTGEQIPDEHPEDSDRDTVAIHSGIISVTPLLHTRTNFEAFKNLSSKNKLL